ncbi:MAG: hypothetical protein AMXMBFR61_07270 [Fimbriimonadales bacterium]
MEYGAACSQLIHRDPSAKTHAAAARHRIVPTSLTALRLSHKHEPDWDDTRSSQSAMYYFTVGVRA